jgi:hypothetical protein
VDIGSVFATVRARPISLADKDSGLWRIPADNPNGGQKVVERIAELSESKV